MYRIVIYRRIDEPASSTEPNIPKSNEPLRTTIDTSHLKSYEIKAGDTRRGIAQDSGLLHPGEDPSQIFLYLAAYNATYHPSWNTESRPTADYINAGDRILLPPNRSQLDLFIGEYIKYFSHIDLSKLQTSVGLAELQKKIKQEQEKKVETKKEKIGPRNERDHKVIDLIPAHPGVVADSVKYRTDKQSKLYPTLNPLPERFQDAQDRCASYVIKRLEQYHGYDRIKNAGLIDFNRERGENKTKLVDARLISGQLTASGHATIPTGCDLSDLTKVEGDTISYERSSPAFRAGLQQIYQQACKPDAYESVIPMHNATSANTHKVLADYQVAEQIQADGGSNTLTLNTHVAYVEQAKSIEIPAQESKTAKQLVAEHLHQQTSKDPLLGGLSLEAISQYVDLMPTPKIQGKEIGREQTPETGTTISYQDVPVSHLIHGVVYRHNLISLIAAGQFSPINMTKIRGVDLKIKDQEFKPEAFDLGERKLESAISGSPKNQEKQLMDRYIRQYQTTQIPAAYHQSYARRMVNFLTRVNLRNGSMRAGKMLPLYDREHKPGANDNHLLKQPGELDQAQPIDIKTDLFDDEASRMALANAVSHKPETMVIAKAQLLCRNLGMKNVALTGKRSDLSSVLEEIGTQYDIERERGPEQKSFRSEEPKPGAIKLNKRNILLIHQLYQKEKNLTKPTSIFLTADELIDPQLKRPPSFHRGEKALWITQAAADAKIFDHPEQFDGKVFFEQVAKAQKKWNKENGVTKAQLYHERFVMDPAQQQETRVILNHLNKLTSNEKIKATIFTHFIEETGKRGAGGINRMIGGREKWKDRGGKQLKENASVGPFQIRPSAARALMDRYMSPAQQKAYLKPYDQLVTTTSKPIPGSMPTMMGPRMETVTTPASDSIKLRRLLEDNLEFSARIAYYLTLDNMRTLSSRNVDTSTQPSQQSYPDTAGMIRRRRSEETQQGN